MKKLNYLFSLLTLVLLLAGCTAMTSLYPLETDKPVDGSQLAGHWLTVAEKGSKDESLNVDFTWNAKEENLLINVYGLDTKHPGETYKLLPMVGKIYELDGEKFICITTDNKALNEILKKSGYDSLLLLTPMFHTMKIEISPDQVVLYSLDYSKPGAKDSDKDKFLSPKLRYDKKLDLMLNDSKEFAEILHDKAYRTKIFMTLKRIPDTPARAKQ